jgi:hypothetical protein
MASNVKGLMGEHMVDYCELARLKGAWLHDETSGKYKPPSVRKLNRNQQPVHLDPTKISLADINHPRIDAVWKHNGRYTVTEAKASINLFTVKGGGELKEKHGNIPTAKMADKTLHYLLGSSKGAAGGPSMTQMSMDWIRSRAPKEGIGAIAQQNLERGSITRHVVLVTLDAKGATEHVEALAVLLSPAGSSVPAHLTHGFTRDWVARDIDAVVKARNAVFRKPQSSGTGSSKVARPSRGKGKS